MSKTVAILDYGVSNLFNVSRMIELAGATPVITHRRADVLEAQALLLPGVGAFPEAMYRLNAEGLGETIRELAKRDHPILGICLGMQVLFDSSEEGGVKTRGLGILPGPVVRLEAGSGAQAVRVPQMGWNRLEPPEGRPEAWAGTLLQDLPAELYMYFLHSFHPALSDPAVGVAYTPYGPQRFCSMVQRGRVVGCQFHPERSSAQGLALLRNFVATI